MSSGLTPTTTAGAAIATDAAVGTAIPPSLCEMSLERLRAGQRALERGPVGRPAVRGKHVLDRLYE